MLTANHTDRDPKDIHREPLSSYMLIAMMSIFFLWISHHAFVFVMVEQQTAHCSRNLLAIYVSLREYRERFGRYPKDLRDLDEFAYRPRSFLCPASRMRSGGTSYVYALPEGDPALVLELPVPLIVLRKYKGEDVAAYCPNHTRSASASLRRVPIILVSGKYDSAPLTAVNEYGTQAVRR
jgi:hypothetical protein